MIPAWIRKILDKLGRKDPRFFELHNDADSYLLFASGGQARIMGASGMDRPLPKINDIIIDGLSDPREKIYYRVASIDSISASSDGRNAPRQNFIISVEEIAQT